jgi:hypothetical protein
MYKYKFSHFCQSIVTEELKFGITPLVTMFGGLGTKID